MRRVRGRRGAVSVRRLRVRAPAALLVLSAAGNYHKFIAVDNTTAITPLPGRPGQRERSPGPPGGPGSAAGGPRAWPPGRQIATVGASNARGEPAGAPGPRRAPGPPRTRPGAQPECRQAPDQAAGGVLRPRAAIRKAGEGITSQAIARSGRRGRARAGSPSRSPAGAWCSAGHGVAPPSCRDWLSRSYCAAGLGLAPIVRRLCTSTARRSAPGGSGACRRSPEVRDCPPASGGEGAEGAACVHPMLLDCAEPPQTVPANASR